MGRDFTQCHPRLQELAAQLVEQCRQQGLTIGIRESFQTVAEQDALYAQGRTKPESIVTNARGSFYSSYHQWGTAFDFYRDDRRIRLYADRMGAMGWPENRLWGLVLPRGIRGVRGRLLAPEGR